jgi:hypothetical protein
MARREVPDHLPLESGVVTAYMSKHETALTEGFWRALGHGAYIPEYPLVRKSADQSARFVDGLILPDEPLRRAAFRDYPSLDGRNVILIQTKKRRMGMYLMGQALFSARLAMASGAASVRSVLLCTASDAALFPLLAAFPEVEVWVCDPHAPTICRRVDAV